MSLKAVLYPTYLSRSLIAVALLFLSALPVLAQGRTFNQIPAAPAPPALSDHVIGVGPGPTDYRYSLSQIQSTIGPGVVNVTNYGAKCDGVTDDTTAIQAAVNAADNNGIVNPNTNVEVIIPARCAISGTITITNFNNFVGGGSGPLMKFTCVGGGSGLVWIGADNAGPMITISLTGPQSPVAVSGCVFGNSGNRFGNKASAAIGLDVGNGTQIYGNTFQFLHDAIMCININGCLLVEIRGNLFGGCFFTCIESQFFTAGWTIQDNEFAWCGEYCIDMQGDTVHIQHNDFEGQVGGANTDDQTNGSKGSIKCGLTGGGSVDGCYVTENRFEDANAASHNPTAFRSMSFQASTQAFVTRNLMGANATVGGPNFYYAVLDAAAAEFSGEYISNPPQGNPANFDVELESSSAITRWIGGLNCSTPTLFGGSNGFLGDMVDACAQGNYALNRATSVVLPNLKLLPTPFASLPASPIVGNVFYVNDGLAANCGDSACTTFGTTVTGGGGFLRLLVWYNVTNWTLIGK